jgi:cell division protein FtsL
VLGCVWQKKLGDGFMHLSAQKKKGVIEIIENNDGFWWLLNLIFLFMIIFSAFFMVYLKDEYRRDFISYQTMMADAASMQSQYNSLLLEESTWASDSRIQGQATAKLNMLVPQTTEMIVNQKDIITPNIKYELPDE